MKNVISVFQRKCGNLHQGENYMARWKANIQYIQPRSQHIVENKFTLRKNVINLLRHCHGHMAIPTTVLTVEPLTDLILVILQLNMQT